MPQGQFPPMLATQNNNAGRAASAKLREQTNGKAAEKAGHIVYYRRQITGFLPSGLPYGAS